MVIDKFDAYNLLMYPLCMLYVSISFHTIGYADWYIKKQHILWSRHKKHQHQGFLSSTPCSSVGVTSLPVPNLGENGCKNFQIFCCSLKLETDQNQPNLEGSMEKWEWMTLKFWGKSENKPPGSKDLCTSLHISERSQLSCKAMLPDNGAPAGGAVTMVARRLQCLLGTYAPQVICDPWCDRVTSMQHDSHHLSGPFQNPKPYCNSHDIKYCT